MSKGKIADLPFVENLFQIIPLLVSHHLYISSTNNVKEEVL